MLDTLPDDLFYHVCLQARRSCTSFDEYDALFSSPLMDVSSTFAARMVSEEYVTIVLTKEWKKNPVHVLHYTRQLSECTGTDAVS